MEQVPEEFTRRDFTYSLIKRTGDITMYAQNAEYSGKNETLGFEVCKVRVRKKSVIFGNVTEAHECLAGDEEFGTCGWSFQRRENAELKFEELVGGQDAIVR